MLQVGCRHVKNVETIRRGGNKRKFQPIKRNQACYMSILMRRLSFVKHIFTYSTLSAIVVQIEATVMPEEYRNKKVSAIVYNLYPFFLFCIALIT